MEFSAANQRHRQRPLRDVEAEGAHQQDLVEGRYLEPLSEPVEQVPPTPVVDRGRLGFARRAGRENDIGQIIGGGSTTGVVRARLCNRLFVTVEGNDGNVVFGKALH